MLDRCSIHRAPFAMDTSRQILDSSLTDNSHVLKLNTSWHLSIHQALCFSLYRVHMNFLHFSSISLNSFRLLIFPNLSLKLQTSNPSVFSSQRTFSSSGMSLFHSFIIHFMHSDQTFRVFQNWWSLGEIFGLGYV